MHLALASPQMTPDSATPFDAVLNAMLEAGGKGTSDLVFVVGQPPQVEINGVLTPVEVPGLMPVLRPEHTAHFAKHMLEANERLETNLRDNGSCDTSYGLAETARFRVNIFRQSG